MLLYLSADGLSKQENAATGELFVRSYIHHQIGLITFQQMETKL
jgi:hypothetical protein